MPQILCVIPARLGSTRLPRKPLAMLGDKPMVQWTYEHAKRCPHVDDVVVATDSDEIAEVITRIGGRVCSPQGDFQTGSDRVAAVAEMHSEADVVVNLQCDEPFIKPTMLSSLVAPYINGEMPEMTTLASPLDAKLHYDNPNTVKVIFDKQDNAIYFSRSPIPYYRQQIDDTIPVMHHMGVYAFTRDFLLTFSQLARTPLEQTESLEQLRALEHGYRIRVCKTDEVTLEINLPEELKQAESMLAQL